MTRTSGRWLGRVTSPARATRYAEPMNRRNFVKAATMLAASPFAVPAADDKDSAIPEYQKPVFNLHKQVAAPVKIASIELLQSGKQFFVRTRSTDGVEGIVLTKDMEDFIPILQRRVIPHFLGKDARDLETPGGRRLHRQLQALRPGLLVPRGLRGAEPLRPAGQDRAQARRRTDGRHPAQGDPGLSLRLRPRHHRRRRGGCLRPRRRGDRREGGEVQDRRTHERQPRHLSRAHRQDPGTGRQDNSPAKSR